MHTRTERYNRRKLISSYFSVTLSITLVLFLLGLLGFLLINAKNFTDSYKENLIMSVFLKDTAKEADIQQLQKTLSIANYIKKVQFISKEQAAQSFIEELGEDFISTIGDNPLKNSFDLTLKADYVAPEKMEEIKEDSFQLATNLYRNPLHLCSIYSSGYAADQLLHTSVCLFQTIHYQDHAVSRRYQSLYP